MDTTEVTRQKHFADNDIVDDDNEGQKNVAVNSIGCQLRNANSFKKEYTGKEMAKLA